MNNKEIIKRIFSYVKRYNALMIFSLLLSVVSVVGALYIPVLVGRAIDLIVDSGAVYFDNIFPILIRIAVIVA